MKKLSFGQQLAIGIILAIIVGLVFGKSAMIFDPFGKAFIKLLKLVVIPLIAFSIPYAVVNLKDISKFGKIGTWSIVLSLVTTAVSCVVAMLLYYVFPPGQGLSIVQTAKAQAVKMPTLGDMLLGFVPDNPVAVAANFDLVGLIVFGVLFGVAVLMTGDKGKPVADFLGSASEVSYKLVYIIVRTAPVGFFAILAGVVGTYGWQILIPFARLIIFTYGGCILFMFVFQAVGIAWAMGGLNPWKFQKQVMEAVIFSWISDSSIATMPITMRNAEENVGVPVEISRFVIPLTTNICKNGTVFYQAAAALMIANIYGIHLTLTQQMAIILAATAAGVGTAGIPSGGFISLAMVFTAAGIPLEGLAIIAGVEPLISRMRTCPNVNGCAAIAAAITRIVGTQFNLPQKAKVAVSSR